MRLFGMLAVLTCGGSLALACGGDDDTGALNSSGGSAGSSTGGAGSGGTSSGGSATGGSGGSTGGSGGSVTGGSGGSTGGSGGSATGGSGGSTGGSGGSATGGTGAFPLDCKSFTSATLDTACTSFASEYCKLLGKCATSLFSLLGLKSESECTARMKLVCQNSAAAPGSNLKPALYAAYGSFLSGLGCSAMWDGTFESAGSGTMPAECGSPGSVANGKNCFTDSQCAGECSVPNDAVCGKCSPGTAGVACDSSSDCVDGFYCSFSTDKCVAKQAIGGTCSGTSTSECVTDAYCDSVTNKCTAKLGAGSACTGSQCKSPLICGASKQCKQAAMGSLGASCDPNETQSCNSLMGLDCDKTSKTCVASPTPGPGQQCGLLQTDGGAVFAFYCSGGAKCVDHTTGPDTCMLPAADGASCSVADGPPCLFPAECVAGKCTLPSSTTCPPN